MSEAKVTLTDRVDVYNFTRGKPLVMDESGRGSTTRRGAIVCVAGCGACSGGASR